MLKVKIGLRDLSIHLKACLVIFELVPFRGKNLARSTLIRLGYLWASFSKFSDEYPYPTIPGFSHGHIHHCFHVPHTV